MGKGLQKPTITNPVGNSEVYRTADVVSETLSDVSEAHLPTSENSVAERKAVKVDAETSPSISWDYGDSAFKNRIKTGVITNRQNLDISTFKKHPSIS